MCYYGTRDTVKKSTYHLGHLPKYIWQYMEVLDYGDLWDTDLKKIRQVALSFSAFLVWYGLDILASTFLGKQITNKMHYDLI